MARRKNEEVVDRRKQLAAAADRFKKFRPASEVLTVVKAVPTRFVQFDHAVRVGGLPIERFMLLHGPSNHGKTLWALGLIESFLAREHLALLLDAERTTSITWVKQLLGPLAEHPGFYAIRPDTYESTMGDVRTFLNVAIDLREQKKIAPDTAVLVVCDSLRKLVPKYLMDEIMAEAKGEITAGQDRGAQLKAKMNAAWMDELTPLLEKANAGFIAVGREMENAGAGKFDPKYKLGGGQAIYFDASLVMRVDRAAWVTHGEGKDQKVYGERHRVTIKKTKVGGKDDKAAVAYFHSSNGVLIPEGFDRARDVIELGLRFEILEKSGSWISYRGERIGGSMHAAVAVLTRNAEWLARIEAEVRSKFNDHKPVEHDEATGEVFG